ncbi:MAG: 1-deoxy-D-xylulose-5-phosphate reductoisomerase [bacterium]
MNLNKRKSITILGSTGSIGKNTMDVIRRNSERFVVHAISANRSVEELRTQIAEFQPKRVVVSDPESAIILTKAFGSLIETGEDALSEIARESDIVVAAMVGFAGLRPTYEAIRAGKRVAIANKETLVVAGELMTMEAKRSGAEIIPIDSEHSAILQCLTGESHSSISKIILTASGGPFRTRPHDTFEKITLAEALNHPNWVMGRKITIDSATMMNKGLEIIEARWLFDVTPEQIEVVIHPQSIIHSLVEFCDGSMKAQLGAPDMRLAIQYALSYPERFAHLYDKLDLLKHSELRFEAPDDLKFPCIGLAREAMSKGSVYPAVLNAANEIAVAAFLDGQILFTEISEIISYTMSDYALRSDINDIQYPPGTPLTLERIFEADKWARLTTKLFASEIARMKEMEQ